MAVYALAVFGSRAISVSKDGTARVWDLDAEPGEEPELEHVAAVDAVAVRAGVAVSGGRDRRIAVWDPDTGAAVRRWDAHRPGGLHEGWIETIALTPAADVVLSAGRDGTLRTWTLDGAAVSDLVGDWRSNGTVALAADEPLAVSHAHDFEDDTPVALWRPDGAAGTVPVEGMLPKVALSADATVAVAADDERIQVLAAADRCVVWSASRDGSAIRSVGVAADGRLALLGLRSGEIEVWDLATRSLRSTLTVHGGEVVAVALSRDGTLACSASWDWALRVWDPVSGEVVASYSNDDWWASCAFTEDGRRLVAGDERGGVHFVALEGYRTGR